PVLDEPLAERYPRAGGVANRGWDRGVRHGDDEVCVHGMLPGQDLAHLLANRIDQFAVHDAVWPGEVDVLEGAGRALRKAGQRQRDRGAVPLALSRGLWQ